MVYNLHGNKQTSRGYILRPARYTTISGNELIRECAKKAMVPKSYAAATLEALAEMTITFLSNGHSVVLPNIGTLSLTADSKAITDLKDLNLRKMVELNIRFRPTLELKKEIDNVGMELGSIFQIVDEEVVKTDTDGNPTKTRKIYRELSKGEALEEQAGGENTDSGNPDVPNNEPNNGTTPGGGSGGADLEG